MNRKDVVKKLNRKKLPCYSVDNAKKLASIYGKRVQVPDFPKNVYRSASSSEPPGITIFKVKDDEVKTLNRMNKNRYKKTNR